MRLYITAGTHWLLKLNRFTLSPYVLLITVALGLTSNAAVMSQHMLCYSHLLSTPLAASIHFSTTHDSVAAQKKLNIMMSRLITETGTTLL